jgi:uncharacterized membrane protein YphA (DoxX/SURF4 family)
MGKLPVISPSETSAAACSTGACGKTGLCGALPMVLRVVLGGLFLLAGYNKLAEPRDFAFAIKGFDLGLPTDFLTIVAFIVPWLEVIAGGLLVLGLFARGAAMLFVAMLSAFTIGLLSVIVRDKNVDCSCFGQLKLFCGEGNIGWCHVIRNGVMLLTAAYLMWKGPGMFALGRK